MTQVPQTQAEDLQKPEQATASAFASAPSRDFDGGLLGRISFEMTAGEALAYLRLKRELSGREKLGLGVWLMASGAATGFLPDWLMGPPDGMQSIAVFLLFLTASFGLLLLARRVWQRLRAARLVPIPYPAVFEEWIDCIAGTRIGYTDEDYLSPELIGQVIDTKTHIFALSFGSAIVIPKRAFATPEAADRMVAHLQELAAGPYYFDA